MIREVSICMLLFKRLILVEQVDFTGECVALEQGVETE
jgi:hypothetical protein